MLFGQIGPRPCLASLLCLSICLSSGRAARAADHEPNLLRAINGLAASNRSGSRSRNDTRALNASADFLETFGRLDAEHQFPANDDSDATSIPDIPGRGAGFVDCNLNGVDDDEDLLPQFAVASVETLTANGSNVIDVKMADMDGDGDNDIVVAYRSSNNVGVLRQNADGGFTPRTPRTCGTAPWLLEVADFNGDGRMDAATINRGGRSISVLLGTGTGLFAAPQTINLGLEPFGFASGDMDNDGDVDLIVCGGPGTCRVLFNDGSAVFTAGPNMRASFPNSLAVGDIDNNGWLDILVGSGPANAAERNAVVIICGSGDGNFDPPVRHNVLTVPMGMKLVDLTGNDNLDLAFVGWQGGGITVMRGNGRKAFASPTTLRFPGQAFSLECCDFDLNGSIDLVSAQETSGSVLVFRNQGNARFDAGIALRGGGSSFQLIPGDIDGDGDCDLAVANGASNNVGLLKAEIRPGSRDLNENGIPDECEADCNWNLRPDDLDLADGTSLDCNENDTPDECDVAPALWLGQPDRHATPTNTVDVVACDLDGDGRPDLATANKGANNVTVALNESDGDGISLGRNTNFQAGNGPWKIACGDLDGNGENDLATVDQDGNTASIFINEGTDPAGDWNGFGTRTTRALGFRPFGLVIAAIGPAGSLSIAAVGGNPGMCKIIDYSDPGFASRSSIALAGPPNSVTAADLDGNGTMDLAIPCSNGKISFLMGDGDGGLVHSSMDFAGEGFDNFPLTIAAADFDDDEDIDFAVVTFASKIVILLNDGNAQFSVDAVHDAPPGAAVISTWDLDSDGDADLATVSEQTQILAIFRNDGLREDGGPNFVGPWGYFTGGGSFRLDAGDLDDDGRLDLLVALGFDNGVSIFQNASLEPTSGDCGANGVPDECEPELHVDINENGLDDSCEPDCNDNGVPDVTDIEDGAATDCDGNGIPDSCQLDCDGDGTADVCQIADNSGLDCDGSGILDSCELAAGTLVDLDESGIPDVCEKPNFHRGDPSHDGRTDLSDGIFIFSFLFLGADAPSCLESADSNDDGSVDISDGIYVLTYLFNGGAAPVEPGPTAESCGQDPVGSPDLGCETYSLDFCVE